MNAFDPEYVKTYMPEFLPMIRKEAEAKAKNKNVVIIDTAGRLHNKTHLMDELNKMQKIDWQVFYGFGGKMGFDCLNFNTMYKNISKAYKEILPSL